MGECAQVDARAIRAAANAEIRTMVRGRRQDRKDANAESKRERRDARLVARLSREPGIAGVPWSQISEMIAQVMQAEEGPVAQLDASRIVRLVWRRIDAATPGVDLRAAEGLASIVLAPLVEAAIDAAQRIVGAKTKKARDAIITALEAQASDDDLE